MIIKKLFFILAIISSSIASAADKDIWVTIFVHGSFSLKPHLNISNIIKMLNDSIEESLYYRSTEINRRDPFFYKNQAMGDLGLHKIDITNPTSILAAPTVALAYEAISHTSGYPVSNQYYTFGWSGLVSHKLRYIEAGFLYKDLAKLANQLRSQGYNPRLRIIGYSHGGNLTLQLGAIHQTKKESDQISIEEFHLIGTPIQVETDYLITSPIFKRVYNWYSRGDGVQTLDFFSFKRFFSKKKFSKRKNFALPKKLTQIRIKISDFIPKKCQYIGTIPNNDKELHKHFREINFDPGHFELWFMGWTTLRYRKEFPINPLPVMIFLPLITQYINNDPKAPHDLVAYVQPCFNRIELFPYRLNRKKQYHVKHPFIEDEIIENMKEQARKFTPDDYNLEIYNRKVYDAIKIIDQELTTVKKITKEECRKNKSSKNKVKLHQAKCIYHEHLPCRKKNINT